MDAADAGRVVALSNQIQIIQQALLLIDEGATITAMTLTRPDPPPPKPEPQAALPPAAPAEEGEEAEESGREEEPAQPDEERPPSEPEEPPALEEEPSVGEITISTEGLTSPPQMMQVIWAQEVQLWQKAYDALAELGVTNVPSPPSASEEPKEPEPQPEPAAPMTERRGSPMPPLSVPPLSVPPPTTGRPGGPPPRSPGRRR